MLIQKCSLWKVAEVFFSEPTKIHYIKEIARKINLAPTSVRVHLKTLLTEKLIKEVASDPFRGYAALRENPEFIFEKKIANLILLKSSGLLDEVKEHYPKSIIVFGSYDKGEDIETSDIDIFINVKPSKYAIEKAEKYLKRKIHMIFREEANKSLLASIQQGTLLYGER